MEDVVFSTYEGPYFPQYFHVVEVPYLREKYAIVRDGEIGSILFVVGKELKGYLGDIIYPQYDGERYGTGNYYLESDRHGIICKWKPNED